MYHSVRVPTSFQWPVQYIHFLHRMRSNLEGIFLQNESTLSIEIILHKIKEGIKEKRRRPPQTWKTPRIREVIERWDSKLNENSCKQGTTEYEKGYDYRTEGVSKPLKNCSHHSMQNPIMGHTILRYFTITQLSTLQNSDLK